MAKRIITLEEKIERQTAVVTAAKEKYDAALDELEKLVSKKKQLNEKKLLEAYRNGSKTAEEIIDFIQSGKREDH